MGTASATSRSATTPPSDAIAKRSPGGMPGEADLGGMPIVPIRWVLIRDPSGQFDPQALLCTNQAHEPIQVLRWFVQRWQVGRTRLGFDWRSRFGKCATTSAWKRSASGRTRPLPARRPACSNCSPLSPCSASNARPRPARPQPPAPGIASSAQPSATRSPPCAAKSGANRVSSRPAHRQTCGNSGQPSGMPSPMLSAMPPMAKVELSAT